MNAASLYAPHCLGWRLAAVALALGAMMGTVQAQFTEEPTSATIFAYARFGDDEYPSGSVRVDQFEAHLRELASDGYKVLPLSEIVAALSAGQRLPERAVGIAIDDTHISVYREAWPRLQAAGLPFTLFVASDTVDRGRSTHMNWDHVRELASNGVEIGNITASFAHLMDQEPAFVVGQIERANERIQATLGRKPRLFAYPYGEYGNALREIVQASGFVAAFGLHSGVAHQGGDRFAIPRFTINEQLGSIERFRLAAQARPLPVTEVTPRDMRIDANPPAFGFTTDPIVGDLEGLACFAVGYGRAQLERVGERRVEVRLAEPFPPGRARINCTMPASEGRWRWFGAQFYVP
jgi:peptidoglycan/xylan/chitin deacetylase (PgdA/CDA1 family)